MSVCLSVRSRISRTICPTSALVACGGGSVGPAVRYVMYFRILWMTSCFHIMQGIGQNQRLRVYLDQFAWRRHPRRSLPSLSYVGGGPWKHGSTQVANGIRDRLIRLCQAQTAPPLIERNSLSGRQHQAMPATSARVSCRQR